MASTASTEAVVEEEPLGPVVPWLLTVSSPVVRYAPAGPKLIDGALAVTWPPLEGSVTTGVGSRTDGSGGVLESKSSTLTVPLAPKALPLTAAMSAPAESVKAKPPKPMVTSTLTGASRCALLPAARRPALVPCSF